MSLQTRIESLVIRIAQEFNTLNGKTGTLASLTTTDKSSLVAAINELQSAVVTGTGIDDANVALTTTYSSTKIVTLLDTLKTEILGGADAPMVEEAAPSLAEKYPAVESYRPLEQQPLAAQPAPEKKRGWGFLGRAKPKPSDLRAEPAPAPRAPAGEPRAVAQPMTRPAPSLDAAPPPAPSDDLFPEQNRDDQFEIPAFLRRQSN